ncbi:MAG: hypothetical protein ACRENS_04670 [Candidatus Eiseniibacteriota bacterium]
MRILRSILILAPFIALLTQLMSPNSAKGLPLFARKNALPCTTCHFAFPRLNAFGMAFRENGYRMPGEKGQSPWESKEFPFAVVGNVGYAYTNTDTADAITGARGSTATLQFVQNQAEFHSAGTLAPDFTFHFDADFAGPGAQLNSGEAFVQFDDLAKDGKLNVKAGFYDADLLYIAGSRRTTNADYILPVTLDGAGAEINGMQSGWTYGLGLINSSRTIGKAGDKTLNNAENPYVWVIRDVKEQKVGGRIYWDHQDPRDPTKSSSLHTQAEISTFLNADRWVVIPGFTYESYSDPDPTQRDKVVSGLLEGLLYLDKNQHWLFTGRYEIRHMPQFDYQGVTAFAEQDQHQEVANVSWYANPNAKVGLEWSNLADNVQGPKTNEVQLYVHVGY